jgi:hypothetical protein
MNKAWTTTESSSSASGTNKMGKVKQYYCNKCGYIGYLPGHKKQGCHYLAYEYNTNLLNLVTTEPVDSGEVWSWLPDEGPLPTTPEVTEKPSGPHGGNSLFPGYTTAKAMADLNFLQDIVADSQIGESKEQATLAICKIASHIGYLEGIANAAKQAIATLKLQMEGPDWDEEETSPAEDNETEPW